MAHSNSARKRIRQNEKRRRHNAAIKTRFRHQMKKALDATAAGDADKAAVEVGLAYKYLDKAAKHNIIHRNAAARHKSRLGRGLAAVGK